MRTQKASLAVLLVACYFETPARESPTTRHAFSLLRCLNLKKRMRIRFGRLTPELALLGGYAQCNVE